MNGPLRIAVADDEPETLHFFKSMLPALGHTVIAAVETGKELVQQCRALRPDLIITDIQMPEMDGIDAAIALSQECPIPVIVISAYHDPALIERAKSDHVFAYLVKPVSMVQLAPAIALAMRRFSEAQRLRKEVDDCHQALADRKLIEQAKGILMKLAGVDEKEAFRRLQELAAERNLKLVGAAQSVIQFEKAFRPFR